MPGCMSPERQRWTVHHVSHCRSSHHGSANLKTPDSIALPVASVKFEGYSQHKTLEVPYFLLGETCLQNPQVSSQSRKVIKKATCVHALVSDFDRC